MLNRIGVELGTNIDITGLRARFYLLGGPSSPFAGAGGGVFYESGLPAGWWKELHVGFEHAFANGLVLALQYTLFLDKRRLDPMRTSVPMGIPPRNGTSYTLTPAVGFRL